MPSVKETLKRFPSIRMAKAKAGRKPHKLTGIDWNTQPLGQVPDLELATRLNVPIYLVYSARRRRGIPAMGRGNTKRMELYDALWRGDEAEIAAMHAALMASKK